MCAMCNTEMHLLKFHWQRSNMDGHAVQMQVSSNCTRASICRLLGQLGHIENAEGGHDVKGWKLRLHRAYCQ